MKQISLLLSVILFACSGASYKYELENRIMSCYVDEQKASGVDVEVQLLDIENLLIEHGVLADGSGRSYAEAFRTMSEGIDAFKGNDKLIDEIKSKRYNIGITCRDEKFEQEFDSAMFNNSKLGLLRDEFAAIREKQLSPKLVARAILKILDENDFENDFYRTTALYALVGDIVSPQGLPNLDGNSKDEATANVSANNILHVHINDSNVIRVGGNKVELSELKPIVKDFLLNKADSEEVELSELGRQSVSKALIVLGNDRGTSYKAYLAVQQELTASYGELRDSISEEHFGAKYESLGRERQREVKEAIPMRISEQKTQ
ncbi:MAG: hypothetical protein ACK5MG_04360 [Bacteroidales bacterium]